MVGYLVSGLIESEIRPFPAMTPPCNSPSAQRVILYNFQCCPGFSAGRAKRVDRLYSGKLFILKGKEKKEKKKKVKKEIL